MYRLTVALTLALLGTGCSTITPASFGAEAPRLSVPWSGPIAVSAAPRENPGSRFNANGIAFEVNLDEFSEHLAGLVTDCLRESGVAVTALLALGCVSQTSLSAMGQTHEDITEKVVGVLIGGADRRLEPRDQRRQQRGTRRY